MTNIKLSVVIPAYNERQTIAACLERVAAALPDVPKEIIVVDDGGTEDTRVLVAETARGARLPLRYLRPTLAHGPAVARNCGWRAARGELVVRTDADDLSLQGRIRAQVAFLDAHPELALDLGEGLAEQREGAAVSGDDDPLAVGDEHRLLEALEQAVELDAAPHDAARAEAAEPAGQGGRLGERALAAATAAGVHHFEVS